MYQNAIIKFVILFANLNIDIKEGKRNMNFISRLDSYIKVFHYIYTNMENLNNPDT